jgi:CBS domain-containing protein
MVVAILAAQGDPEVLTMDKIRSRPLITVTDMAGILEAMQLTCQHGIRRLPIVNADSILVGIVMPIVWWRW